MNNTKIKYLLVADKLYLINCISFFHMSMEVSETNSLITNVPEDEVWRIEDFKNYSIKLINNGGQAEIVDFSKYRKVNKKQ